MKRRLPGFVLVSVVVPALIALGYLLLVYPREVRPGRGEHLVVELTPGMSPRVVADRLAEAGVIEDPWLFAVYLRVRGRHIRSGAVLLSDRLPPDEVARRISRGERGLPVRVTIPEGFNRWDVALRLAEAGVCTRRQFVQATAFPIDGERSGTHEGYLFPDTYDFHQDSSPAEVARRMVDNYRRRTGPLFERHARGMNKLRHDLGWGHRDVLTLASVVEKEAAVARERPTIAGVFLNRLRSETFRPLHRLQADPTVTYGCHVPRDERAPSCEGSDGGITRAMLQDSANTYNTYRHGGLPPGPITNPGLAAIEAVLAPDEHDYFYFVARGGGRHQFSAELDAHNEAVDEFNRN